MDRLVLPNPESNIAQVRHASKSADGRRGDCINLRHKISSFQWKTICKSTFDSHINSFTFVYPGWHRASTALYSRHMTSTQSPAMHRLGPEVIPTRILTNVVKVIACSCIIALGAQLELKLPYTPVPITGQSLSVVIGSLLFGRKIALAGTATYLLEGASGLPVFSGGGAGLHHFAGPTGGYLLGFLPAAYAAGWAKDRGFTRSPIGVFITVIAASIPIFSVGVIRLWMIIGDLNTALSSGLYPFIAGDFMKALLASMLTPLASLNNRK